MKLVNEISAMELNNLINAGSILPELAQMDGWKRRGDVFYHRAEGVVVEIHSQSEPAAYSDIDDVGAAIARGAGFEV